MRINRTDLPGRARELAAAIQKRYPKADEYPYRSWSYPQGYDIYSTGNDKTTTIESVLKRLGISWAETMAFGDGENDIPMLVKAGVGVAVANAKDNVKAAADYIAPSVDEDGVAEALRHFSVIA